MKFTTAVAAAGLASVAVAQSLSSQCTVQLGLLAVGDLGQCLALSDLIPIVTSTSKNSSVVAPLNSYLGSLCSSSTPTCSNATLTSAESTIQSACASDLASTGNEGTAVEVLDGVFQSYPEFYTAACSKNETTNSYCVTSILYQVQNATGQQLSFDTVSSLLSGNTQGLSQLNSALNDGQLCTGCVAGIYRQAIAANASITSIPAVSSIAARCGSGFGTSASETGVSSSSLASGTARSNSASSSPASSSHGAGHLTASYGFSAQALMGAAVVVGGVLAGAATVF